MSNVHSNEVRVLAVLDELEKKADRIKAFIFDWDGVFNNGFKDLEGGSPFSEVGSMGVNMLRFAGYLKNGKMPVAAVISGRKNPYAKLFGEREHLHAVYMGYSDKRAAFQDFLDNHALEADEVAFVFDDILDLSIASRAGLRVMIGGDATLNLQEQVESRGEADAITSCDGGNNGLRQACEFIISQLGNFDQVVDERVEFDGSYVNYLQERNSIETRIHTNGR
jgi:3-deoxy-D-manno-octulosonate 8-phosphate phosphatase (KDO 8-P phosphatase)